MKQDLIPGNRMADEPVEPDAGEPPPDDVDDTPPQPEDFEQTFDQDGEETDETEDLTGAVDEPDLDEPITDIVGDGANIGVDRVGDSAVVKWMGPDPAASGADTLKIKSAATGNGQYTCILGVRNTTDFTPATDIDLSAHYTFTDDAAHACLLVNMDEDKATTHQLPVGKILTGCVQIGVSTDSLPVPVYVVGWTANKLFDVTLSPISGSAGDSSNYCSFTYTVKTIGGTTIAISTAPLNSRARIVKGACTPATQGSAYFDDSGNVVLWDANETVNNLPDNSHDSTASDMLWMLVNSTTITPGTIYVLKSVDYRGRFIYLDLQSSTAGDADLNNQVGADVSETVWVGATMTGDYTLYSPSVVDIFIRQTDGYLCMRVRGSEATLSIVLRIQATIFMNAHTISIP